MLYSESARREDASTGNFWPAMEKLPPKSPGLGRPTEAFFKNPLYFLLFEVVCGEFSAKDFFLNEVVLKAWETRAKVIPRVAP